MSEMSEPTAGGSHSVSGTSGHGGAGAGGTAAPVDYALPSTGYGFGGGSSTLRLGGALGIAACAVGLLVLVASCAGLSMAVVLSLVPVGLSLPGLVLTILAAVKDKALITEDTHVLQALFANIAGLIGGLLEMAAWRHWPLF